MAEGVLELNDGNFDEQTGSGVTLVDFWAPWCGPCRMQTPIIEKVATRIGDRAKIAKVNVDDAQNTAARLQIRSIPTLIVFKDGNVAQQFVGLRQEDELVQAVEAALS